MLWLAGIYLLISIASLAVFVGLIVALPPGYFAEQRGWWIDRHPLTRCLMVIAKNLVGLAIVALGVLLALPGMPGQGLITIMIGAMLLDFPGKQRLMRNILHRRGVINKINRLRRFFRRPPLIVP